MIIRNCTCLCACVWMALPGCTSPPNNDDNGNGNGNDNSSQSETRDFSSFSSFSYTLSDDSGPLSAPAEGIVGTLQITRGEDGEYTLNFSVSDGAGGLVEVPERLLSSDQQNQMLALFGDVTVVTVQRVPGCDVVGILAFFEAFDWDGEVYDRVSSCFAATGISVDDHETLSSFLDDLVGEDGAMRSI